MSKKAGVKERRSLTIGIATMTVAILITSIISVTLTYENNNMAFAQHRFFHRNPFAGATTHFTFGPIGSIQNGESGKPAWILSGSWKTNLANQSSNMINASNAIFDTSFRMIMLNGSAMHTHAITNFVLKNKSMPNKSTEMFNGTSTVSMKQGPVTNVPTSIKITGNKVISIWLDPSKLKNHFGNTPIYGTVFEPRIAAGFISPHPPRMMPHV
jgi:hypothetical protein